MRIKCWSNKGNEKKLGHGVLRHRGTVQHLFWFGPIFFVVRNRASALAARSVRP